jgi:hypothetical protein
LSSSSSSSSPPYKNKPDFSERKEDKEEGIIKPKKNEK